MSGGGAPEEEGWASFHNPRVTLVLALLNFRSQIPQELPHWWLHLSPPVNSPVCKVTFSVPVNGLSMAGIVLGSPGQNITYTPVPSRFLACHFKHSHQRAFCPEVSYTSELDTNSYISAPGLKNDFIAGSLFMVWNGTSLD